MSDEPIMRVGGDLSGTVVVGDHNVVITHHGTHVSANDGDPPAPRRRPKPGGTALPRGVAPLGRDADLARLDEWIAAGEPVQVHGERGIGKSAVLRAVAARHAAAGEDVVFLSAAGLVVEDIVQELFQACYEVPAYRPDEDRLQRLMGRIQALFVVDDFMGDEDDLRSLVAAVPAGDLVVASERRTMFTQGRALTLAGLTEEPAMELAVRELGHDPDEAEDAALRALVRATGGHPAAVVQAAAAARAHGPEVIAPDAETAVLAEALATGLDAGSRTALTMLCALEGVQVTADMAETLTGDPSVREGLERLAGVHLAESGYMLAGRTAAAVATAAELAPDAGRYAAALAAWARTASARQTGQAAPVVV
ncbi:hypothetical protein, partial [Actinomadura roseirufa]|uniref:hypothetical protein n=1 Tax=Actinomadura roseirufa TaxID=2094049 RepID=UPI001A9549FA